MIVGEVKEGAARLNRAMRDPGVLEVALARFGCCPPEDAHEVTRELLANGHAENHAGQTVRIIAFGDTKDEPSSHSGRTTVSMRHVVEYLQGYLSQHWPVLRHAYRTSARRLATTPADGRSDADRSGTLHGSGDCRSRTFARRGPPEPLRSPGRFPFRIPGP